MNPKKRIFILWLLVTVFSLNGCNETADFEYLDLLTQKTWELTERMQDGIDITEDCDLDDVLIFENAADFDYDAGTLTCFDFDQSKSADTWKIIDDFTVLRMKFRFSNDGKGTLIEYWKITELSENLLVMEDALAEDNGQVPEIRTYQSR